MPGDPSPRRRPRLNLLAISAAALFTILFLASLRYAIIISPGPSLGIGLIAGGLWLNPNYGTPRPSFSPFPGTVPMRPALPIHHPPMYIYRHGFSFQWWFEGPTGTYTSWSAPLWPLLALLLSWPAILTAHRHFGRKPWQCPSCRYDLRGLATGVCPECGLATRATAGDRLTPHQ